MDVAKANKIS